MVAVRELINNTYIYNDNENCTTKLIYEYMNYTTTTHQFKLHILLNNNKEKQQYYGDYIFTNIMSFPSTSEMLLDDNIAVCDTGSTAHFSGSDRGAENEITWMNHSTTDASGNNMKVTKVFDLNVMLTDRYGNELSKAKITRIRYAKDKPFTLLATNKYMEKGFVMNGNKEVGIRLTKGNVSVTFDIPIRTNEGVLWCLHMKRLAPDGLDQVAEVSCFVTNIVKAHGLLGHSNEAYTRKTAEHLGWKVTRGTLGNCESCAIGKARQKNLGKGESNPPNEIGEMYYIDGMSLKKTKKTVGPFPSQNCMVMMTEYHTGHGFVNWFESKDGFINDFCKNISILQSKHKYVIKRLRGDGAGENNSFLQEMNSARWKFNVTPEWTPRDTPQQNRVENPIFVCCMRARTLQASANVPNDMKNVLFPYAYKCAFDCRSLEVINVHGVMKTRAEHFNKELPNFSKYLRRWGEAGTVKTTPVNAAKSRERGVTCIFVGYADKRPGDCYVMIDPKSKNYRPYFSRDVIFLNRNYYTKSNVPRNGSVIQVQGINHIFDTSADQGSVVVNEIENEIDNESNTDDQDFNQMEDESNNDQDDNSNNNNEDQENDDDEVETAEEEEPPTRTRTGRKVKPRVRLDGSSITNYGVAALIQEERNPQDVIAVMIDIEDELLSNTYDLGDGEINHIAESVLECPSMTQEELILSTLGEEECYEEIDQAYGINNEQGEFMLVAAVLKKEEDYFLVGATGHNYGNTAELSVMNYKQAMETINKEEWLKAIKIEHAKMQKYNVFEVVHPKDVPKGTKLMNFTWAMKKNASGVYRARLAARGFQQKVNSQYREDDKSSPVINDVSIKIVLTLIVLAGWSTRITDVEGAFLNGSFERKHEKLYTEVPEGLKDCYPWWAILLMLKSMYGTIQGALQWFREICMALKYLSWERNKSDPCLFYKWTDDKLVVFLLWVDDCLVAGPEQLVTENTTEFRKLYDTTDEGEMTEYVGCKVERTFEQIRLTQPVKIKRLMDEFGYDGKVKPNTPAKPGSVLSVDSIGSESVSPEEATKFKSVIGMTNHMVRWSRVDCQNPNRECSQQVKDPTKMGMLHMDRMCEFMVATGDRGYTVKPDLPGSWDSTKNYKFKISGESDSEYAKDPTRRSVNCGATFLCGALIKMFCKMMPIVALSTTEAELYSAVLTAQDMMFAYYIMIGMGLTVELPMVLYIDNRGAVDLANNWSVGGRTRHMDVKQNYLRELKESGMIRSMWKSGEEITTDMNTKNTQVKTFWYHSDKVMSFPSEEELKTRKE